MLASLLIMISIIFLVMPQKSLAHDEVVAGNSGVFVTHEDMPTAKAFSKVDAPTGSNTIDSAKSYSMDHFAENAGAQYFWLHLKNDRYKPVTGIKASRIEMIQDGIVVARANEIESYSVNGEYYTQQFEMINAFQNTNGENLVDVVLYLGSKEVGRVKDHSIFIYNRPIVNRFSPHELGVQSPKFNVSLDLLNVDEKQEVDVYLTDQNGNKVSSMDKKTKDYYSKHEKKRRMELSLTFTDTSYLEDGASYEYVVEVNGQSIKKYRQHTIRAVKDSSVYTTYLPNMPDLRYNVTGVNLLNHNPYRLVIEQNGKITKELTNVVAFFNEETYNEEINVELLQEYFTNHGGTYEVKLYNAKNELKQNYTFLVEKDDTGGNEQDLTNPYEGFKTFGKKENVEPNKTWRVKFNRPVDEKSINNGNAYIINKQSGQSVKVEFAMEEQDHVLAITPEMNFTNGAAYTLIIDKRVTSGGKELGKPAAIEFTVK